MGDSPTDQLNAPRRQTRSYSKLTKKKGASMNLEDTITTCLRIINNILNYTSTLEAQDTSFDYSSRQDTETDSDSDRDSKSEECFDIEQYFTSIINYLNLDKSLLILSMMTFDKLLQKNPGFIFSERNCQKVIFLCLMETHKFYEDETFTNKDYAKVGKVEVNELLQLEIEFLSMIQFDMNNSLEAFTNYSNKLTQYWEKL